MSNQQRTIFLHLICSVFFVDSSRVHASLEKSFIPDSRNGTTVVCVVDEVPSKVVSLASTSFAQSSCIPWSAICGSECSKEARCTNFNYRSDEETCELFFYTPLNWNQSDNCWHFRVSSVTTPDTLTFLSYR